MYINLNTYIYKLAGAKKDGLNPLFGGVLQSSFPSLDLRTEMPSLENTAKYNLITCISVWDANSVQQMWCISTHSFGPPKNGMV